MQTTSEIPPLHVVQEVASVYGLKEAKLAGGPLEGRGYLTFRLATDRGDLALRRKKGSGLKISTKHPDIGNSIERQHALISFLNDQGFPVAAPLVTRNGRTYVSIMGVPYSLYPFINGQAMDPSNTRQLSVAAQTLARYHRLTARYPGIPPLFQDPFPKLLEARLNDFRKDTEAVELSLSEVGMAESLTAFKEVLRDIEREVLRLPYDDLPKVVIHGDYKPGNILFQGDELAAVIDFGRSRNEARILDLAKTIPGLARNAYDETFLDLARAFIAAYDRIYPLQVAERKAIPVLISARVAFKALEKFAKAAEKKETVKKLKKARKANELVQRLQWLRENSANVCALFQDSSALQNPNPTGRS